MAQKDLFNARHDAQRREKALKRLLEKRTETEKRFHEEGFKGMEVSWYRLYQSFFQKSDHDLEMARIRLQKGEERVFFLTVFFAAGLTFAAADFFFDFFFSSRPESAITITLLHGSDIEIHSGATGHRISDGTL